MKKFHSLRLRHGRFSSPNQGYLLTTVTYQRQQLFNTFAIGRLVVNTLKQLHENDQVYSLAFVVMPDHLHWLVQLRHGSLKSIMQQAKGLSARHINEHLNLKGRVWQPGYHDHALRKEEDLKACARYIIANPLRADIVSHVADYPLWDYVWV